MGQEDPLEKGTATLSSSLVWEIPWTKEPGRLQPMGPQSVGHNCATNFHFQERPRTLVGNTSNTLAD